MTDCKGCIFLFIHIYNVYDGDILNLIFCIYLYIHHRCRLSVKDRVEAGANLDERQPGRVTSVSQGQSLTPMFMGK